MQLVRLVYYSRASREMNLADLQSILTVARDNNQKLGVCGMLCYDNLYFLQALEGERETVSELFLSIADDPRHDEVVICHFEYIEETKFKNWNMGYAGSSPLFQQLLQKLGQSEFDPAELKPVQTLAILLHLSSHQTEV